MADPTEIFNTLSDELMQLVNDVDLAVESSEEARQIEAGNRLDDFVARYQAALAALDPATRQKYEMRFDRRVIDVRRAAAKLTRRSSGQKAQLARDAGTVPFVLQRDPGRSMGLGRGVPRSTLSVGSDVEAWCGKCREVREHRIVAMVAGEPKQVVCNTCNSRHNYRTDPPARAKAALAAEGSPVPTASTGGGRLTDRESDRQREEKRKLQRELADAAEPREFDPKGRYKAGEIIVHPEHGRGKVENVLRSSLLVRFLDGLRPVDLA